MAANRRPAEEMPLGLCCLCGDMVRANNGLMLQGAESRTFWHSGCANRAAHELTVMADRCTVRNWLGVGDDLPDGESVTA